MENSQNIVLNFSDTILFHALYIFFIIVVVLNKQYINGRSAVVTNVHSVLWLNNRTRTDRQTDGLQ